MSKSRRWTRIAAVVIVLGAGAYWWIDQRNASAPMKLPPPPAEALKAVRPVDLTVAPAFVCRPVMMRELARQALLMAERDECGLATRDVSLGESRGEVRAAAARELEVQCFLRGMTGVEVQLFRTDPGGPEPDPALAPVTNADGRHVLFQTLLPIPNENQVDYGIVLDAVEGYARNEFRSAVRAIKSDVPPATRGAGHPSTAETDASASAPASRPSDAAGADALATGERAAVEQRLGEMNFISQYAAVRAGHARVRAGSWDAMGTLARGYANLGQLVAYQWTAASRAFAARSLLYAQRMVKAAPPGTAPQALALRHRAYALALAGFQGAAMKDLDRADALDPAPATRPIADGAGPGDASAARPAWVTVIRPYCQYRSRALSDIAFSDPAAAPLALFLCFLTIERSNSTSLIDGYGQVVLAKSPDCMRVIDAMVTYSGVGAQHVLTTGGLTAILQSMSARLPLIPDLPQSVRDALSKAGRANFDPTSAAAVTRALIDAGANDDAEPSWAVLVRLVQEAQFITVERRAVFMVEMLGVDASGFINAAKPLYKDHPYAGLVDLDGPMPFGMDRAALLAPVVEHLRHQQPTRTFAPLLIKLDQLRVAPPKDTKGFWDWQWQYHDYNNIDIESILSWMDERPSDPNLLKYIERNDPDSPTYIATMISFYWDEAKDRVEGWKRDHGDHPIVAAALARRYSGLKQYAEAEKYLRAYIATAPDQWAFEQLASNYYAQRDEAQYIATLKARLQYPDYGLEHAQTNVKIARYYMTRGKFAEARPFADGGAESYAQWALETAAECYDGLRDHAKAAAIRRAMAERYGGMGG